MRSSNGPLKLFVGNLGENHKSDLNRLFSKYGEISNIYVDENKRFAFVEFTSSIDAQRALERTNNKTVNGSKLRVEFAKSDKTPRDHRRPLSRDRSPTSILYGHLQVTANRLPPMQIFRQNYYQNYSSSTMNSIPTSRGRSLTPPSYKQNSRLSSMNNFRTQDFYYQHPSIYSDPNFYRTYVDPYLMQRLPPVGLFPPTSPPSSSRTYRNVYSSSGVDHYASNILTSHHQRQRRSRSRRRTSPSRRDRKRKRRTSSSSSTQQRERGPQTPPPSKSSTHRSRKRSRSDSDPNVRSISEQKSSSNSSSEDEEKISRSAENDSNRKYSKRRTKQ